MQIRCFLFSKKYFGTFGKFIPGLFLETSGKHPWQSQQTCTNRQNIHGLQRKKILGTGVGRTLKPIQGTQGSGDSRKRHAFGTDAVLLMQLIDNQLL